jgi:hypothetical protein
METTHHAEARARQRGIPEALLRIVEECGNVTQAPGGAEQIFFGRREAEQLRKELKPILQIIDKAQGTAIIVSAGRILTAFKRQDN